MGFHDHRQHYLDYPQVPLLNLLSFLDAKDLLKLMRACKMLNEVASYDLIWKEKCFMDFPWFFFNGTCEKTLIPCVNRSLRRQSPKKFQSFDDILIDAATKSVSLDGIPVCEGDLGATCRDRHTIRDNPYHPLLKDKDVKYRVS
jgi:hypothetical protein